MHVTRFLFLGMTSLVFAGICRTAEAQPLPPVPSKSLPQAQPAGSTEEQSFVSPVTRNVFQIHVEPKDRDSDAEEGEPASEGPELAATPRSFAPGLTAEPARRSTTDGFDGTDRKAAKLSIATGALESFSDLKDLLATLPAKEKMVGHNPKITRGATSNRVKEENRNVRVICWLYAAARESDNDFHLILGREPGATPPRYMTMEVSGLPPTSARSFQTLSSARMSFKTFFGSRLPTTGYDFYHPPIPVQIEGSLFFDITHAEGTPPGPASLRPNMPVIWEVHPVTKIEFEPQH